MTDYSAWKVVDLKAELKRRGIPQTGLRVKQNFIDKLVEEDEKRQDSGADDDSAPAQAMPDDAQPVTSEQTTNEPAADGRQPEESKSPVRAPEPVQPREQETQEQAQEPEDQKDEAETEHAQPESVVEEQKAGEDTEKKLEEMPQQIQQENLDQEAQDAQTKPANGVTAETEHPAKPVEQAPEPAEEVQPTPTEQVTEKLTADESAVTLPSSVPTEGSTPVPVDEAIEDSRKRKRRSQSPIPTAEAVASKKAKAQEESPKVILPEDNDAMEVEETTQKDPAPEEPSTKQPLDQHADEGETVQHKDTRRASLTDDMRAKGGAHIKQDARFKGLFAPTEREQVRPPSPPADTTMGDVEVEPAVHVATPALYIDGLMRPLQPAALRNHLVSIATAPGSSPDPDVVVDFYLDPIKTHSFVGFSSISAASRARSALHGNVWPNERNRKALFVDFIPETKLEQWIAKEEESRGRGGPPARFEVKYEQTDNGIEAVLQEVDPKNATSRQAPTQASGDFSRPPPSGPRASMANVDRRPSGPPPPEPQSRPGQGFKPLDDLFESTKTKPKLYYLPVPREVADRRLDRFDDLLRKGSFPRRGGDETRRITFEDEDLFVDQGPEYGARSARGPRGRGRGRGGGMRQSWRGDRRGHD
ncbi:SAP domain protein [Aspergillus clavatus NRRL 1]|uniref:SAP domain protein n=1 Tax=Aspergillus clavatus (strain ATCC 1007 / CBS 513.65 / DSM 816 / NCTC 3887 / NRRL 1 / QM 1276 / 107) TaxID=344612 RepID=A1CA55_ASPCL|nr:SAP domain protein [Aspergillus clavatus NRRL 1]EAW12623.1 SAP domain protein [Aspergillus clavatus NRRL 1]